MLCLRVFVGHRVLSNTTQSSKDPKWCKWQKESLGLRQHRQQVPAGAWTARHITADAQHGQRSKKAASTKVLSLDELLSMAKALSNDDLKRYKQAANELAEDSARATPPPELAEWGIELVPISPNVYDGFKHYILTVKGQDYGLKATNQSWLMASRIAEDKCSRLYIADLLVIEEHTSAF